MLVGLFELKADPVALEELLARRELEVWERPTWSPSSQVCCLWKMQALSYHCLEWPEILPDGQCAQATLFGLSEPFTQEFSADSELGTRRG